MEIPFGLTLEQTAPPCLSVFFPNTDDPVLGEPAALYLRSFRLDTGVSQNGSVGGDNIIEDLAFHDVRHMFASWWVRNEGDLYARMTLLGHSSLRMVQRYVHLGASGTHRAVRAEFPHSSSTTAPDGPEQNHLTV